MFTLVPCPTSEYIFTWPRDLGSGVCDGNHDVLSRHDFIVCPRMLIVEPGGKGCRAPCRIGGGSNHLRYLRRFSCVQAAFCTRGRPPRGNTNAW
jgi:hypothetical protein